MKIDSSLSVKSLQSKKNDPLNIVNPRKNNSNNLDASNTKSKSSARAQDFTSQLKRESDYSKSLNEENNFNDRKVDNSKENSYRTYQKSNKPYSSESRVDELNNRNNVNSEYEDNYRNNEINNESTIEESSANTKIQSAKSEEDHNQILAKGSKSDTESDLDQDQNQVLTQSSLPQEIKNQIQINDPQLAKVDFAGDEVIASDNEFYNEVGKLQQLKNAKTLNAQGHNVQKQEAMINFLVKMNQDMGIKPEEVINAFKKMSQTDMALPPQMTIGSFADKFDQQSDKKDKIKNLYAELIVQTEGLDIHQVGNKKDKSIDPVIFTTEGLREKKLIKNIETLSKDFFSSDSKKTNSLTTKSEDKIDILNKNFFDTSKPKQIESDKQNSSLQNVSNNKEIDLSESQFDKLFKNEDPNVQNDLNTSQNQNLNNYNNFTDEELASNNYQMNNVNDKYSKLNSKDKDDKTISELKNKFKNEKIEITQLSQNPNEVTEDYSFSESSEDLLNGDKLNQRFDLNSNAPITTQNLMGEQKNNQLEIRNLDEVMEGAKFLASQGGGRMKLQLNPEGLGTVELDVRVQNGQIGVSITAENSDTKKLLESSLSDLRIDLLDSKLQIDSLKVDSSSTRNELENQQKDQNREASRQYAQDFLGNFRNQNQARQSSFADVTGIQSYTNTRPKRLTPGNVHPKLNPVSSRRLDLVA